ncbi:C4-dicarboxylate ABC transporter permease [Halorubrum sp. Atlit-8R]|uniref:TRAP transporter permease n=1 Tax=unclassified Halorubrum TaxID=2642239 RepID=UPI000EF1D0C1|nr:MULTISPECIES: TRAP transporter fused permease subunit [unclassified Halorubrum]RLM66992.1 C4-dicarboxylate ABC transporter permease [Halorubrum sp. Atlit-9R]RLM81816.1 C4-dicarboxylate ABC transporter permease [Halorubrum sp. Atlit-8R]
MSTETASTDSESGLLRGLDVTVTGAALLFWAGVLYWAQTQAISQVRFATAFVGGILTVYALNETRLAISDGDWIDGAVLIPASLALMTASAFFAINFQDVYLQRQGYALEHEYMLARLVILSLMYLTWREFGNVFLGLVFAVFGYAMFGNLVPGVLGHAGMNQATLLQATVTDLYGFYGSLTQITASWIAPFLLYAGLLFAYGAFDLILRVAIVAAKYIESGIAQTAVLSSAVIGSINGSYTANAAMTGSFTIPTMQEAGMKGHRAAGIEAVASTSGQVLPPVMGASAFVMASYLGVPYLDIVVAGLVPAAILVVSISIAVHYLAISDSSSQDMEFSEFFDETLSTEKKVFEAIRFGVPFGILIYLLGIAQYTVMTSALYTVVAMMITGTLMPPLQRVVDSSGVSPVSEVVTQVKNTVHGIRRGAIILAPIAIILVVISGVVNLFSTTGIPAKIALLLINISGGVLLFAVLLGMGVAILMGVGMPTVAAYVIVAILIVPTFVSDFNVPAITAHYTMFYAAILAGITPPVATAAVIAAGIAEANFWRTCGAAIRIAAPLFILPVAFVYNPGLISMDVGLNTLYVGLLVLLGAVTIIYGLNYPFKMRPGRKLGARALLATLGVLIMVYPSNVAKIAGIAVFAAVFVAEKVMIRGLTLPFGRGASQ